MTDAFFATGDGQTELSDDDREGLIPTYVATRADLFAAEQLGIALALIGRSPSVTKLLDDKYLRDLHRAMFREVWRWAGRYRIRETNIGIDPSMIPTAVRSLVDNARAWVEFESFGHDELAVRFHHRLVQIHPFPNGNGRHARIAADLLSRGLGNAALSWGRHTYSTTASLREAYVRALRRADQGAYEDLVAFARG